MIRRPPKPPDPNAAFRRQAALRKLAQALRSRITLPGQSTGQTARDPRVDQLLYEQQQSQDNPNGALPARLPRKNQ